MRTKSGNGNGVLFRLGKFCGETDDCWQVTSMTLCRMKKNGVATGGRKEVSRHLRTLSMIIS